MECRIITTFHRIAFYKNWAKRSVERIYDCFNRGIKHADLRRILLMKQHSGKALVNMKTAQVFKNIAHVEKYAVKSELFFHKIKIYRRFSVDKSPELRYNKYI